MQRCGCIDADHFKRVNDEHGHQVGDQVPQEVAARVRGRVRASDTLGHLGGEEFGLVLPDATADDGRERGETVCAMIAATPVRAGGGAIGWRLRSEGRHGAR